MIVKERTEFLSTGKMRYTYKNHNHAELMPNLKVLHRKGATSAKEGEYGIVPGNMRDGSYIVVGLSNDHSLNSCSHGAGRSKSRSQAKKDINMETFTEQMEGIIANVSEKHLDEAPDAYKSISSVMAQQQGLGTKGIVDHSECRRV